METKGYTLTVEGHDNVVERPHTMIVGHENTIKGNDCCVKGNNNIITGSNCVVYGENNVVRGLNCRAYGANNLVFHQNEKQLEEQLRISGTRPTEVPDTSAKYACNICCNYPISTVLSPCRHALMCTGCAKDLCICPVCRAGIEKVEIIYL